MSEVIYTPDMGERIAALLADFKLATSATELVPRLLAAGEERALVLVREVLELEAQGRMERRVDRLRKASKLPPGKRLDTLDRSRVGSAPGYDERDDAPNTMSTPRRASARSASPAAVTMCQQRGEAPNRDARFVTPDIGTDIPQVEVAIRGVPCRWLTSPMSSRP